MGLNCTHGAFDGAYSAFNRFRQAVAQAAGGSFPPHDDPSLDHGSWFVEGDDYSQETHKGLWLFLNHSDCDGDLSPRECELVAQDLSFLMPFISTGDGGGHLSRMGGYRGAAKRFIDGCNAAVMAGERLEFH